MVAILEAICSPLVILAIICLLSIACLSIDQVQTNEILETLDHEKSLLNKRQTHLLSTRSQVQKLLVNLNNSINLQGKLIGAVEKYFYEKLIIISGIPEQDTIENSELIVRNFLSEELGLSFGEFDVEEVKRFDKKVMRKINNKTIAERKFKVKFFRQRDKNNVLDRSGLLNGTFQSIHNYASR